MKRPALFEAAALRPVAGMAVALLLSGMGALHAATPTDSIAERTRACTACHGQEGRATREGYFPRIAGKPPGYLYNQLLNFRMGRRQAPAMAAIVDVLTDDYLREIAQYFGTLDVPYAPPPRVPATPAVLARGEQLVRQGDAARGIPACAGCHGIAMTGVAPAFPGLLGLPRDYLLGQLGAWQTGQRHAAEPDCMAQIARRLSAEDVATMATWLAAQPVPAHAPPAAGLAAPPAMECGSGLR